MMQELVAKSWDVHCHGVPMYRVVVKLKNLHHVFKEINRNQFADIELRVKTKKEALLECQNAIHRDPGNHE